MTKHFAPPRRIGRGVAALALTALLAAPLGAMAQPAPAPAAPAAPAAPMAAPTPPAAAPKPAVRHRRASRKPTTGSSCRSRSCMPN